MKPGSQNDRLIRFLSDGQWLVPHPNRAEILQRATAFPAPEDVMQARWLSKIEFTATCWLWTGTRHTYGHGYIHVSQTRSKKAAYRLAYEWFVGPIPEGLEIDHVCRVPSCVNPTHLEAVTHAENVRRGDVALIFGSRTHCGNGHPFSGDNVRGRSDCNGRVCRTCAREANRRFNARHDREELRAKWRAEYHRRKNTASLSEQPEKPGGRAQASESVLGATTDGCSENDAHLQLSLSPA